MHFTALIIDADGKTPATLKNVLAPYGFEFTVTENGPEAVNVARQAAPDIILLRAELPLTTGFSVCNRLRRNDDTRKIPLILYSSNASDDVIEQHRNLKTHADHYLKLPLDQERLLGAVRSHLKLGARGAASNPPAPQPEPSAARPAPRSRLDVELTDPTPATRPPADEVAERFEHLTSAPQTAAARVSGPAAASPRADESGSRRLSQPDLAALGDSEASDGGTGFKAQREALALKSQLNQKNREILNLKEQLEARERSILDAKKQNRDLQTQAGEFEAQLLSAQEQMLSAREAADVARRDMQTALKREEGQKTRLEVTQKKLREIDTELTALKEHSARAEQQATQALTEARSRIEVQSSLISDLEAERDDLASRLTAAETKISVLQDDIANLSNDLVVARENGGKLVADMHALREAHAEALAAAAADRDAALAEAASDREQAVAAVIQGRDEALAALAETHKAELAALVEAHRAELARQDAEYRAAAEKLTTEALEQAEQAEQEQARLNQLLVDAEENARLQISQLTQTLSATEETARAEIQRLTQNLAASEEHARSEIQSLKQAAAEAAEKAAAESAEQNRRITAALADIDELGVSLDRSETSLHRRKEAAQAAQQALAVALRLLEDPAGEAS